MPERRSQLCEVRTVASMTIKERLAVIANGQHLDVADTVAADAIREIERLESRPDAGCGVRLPHGYALVPTKPTPAMIEAGCEQNPTQWNEGTDLGFAADVANDVYVAMVSAATISTSPVAAESNASAEARLREALMDVCSLFDDEGNFREEHQDHASTALEKAERAMALSAVGDEAKKSEGGKPSSEASSHEKRRLDASDEQTSTGPETSISPVRTIAQSPASAHTANHGVTAGETATPSDPTADRREIVARIINPAAFNSPRSDPGISVAREKADAILAALDRGR